MSLLGKFCIFLVDCLFFYLFLEMVFYHYFWFGVRSVRKNFLFEKTVVEHLEEIANSEGKTQTQIVQEAVEERYKQTSAKKKLIALERLTGSLTGKIGNIDAKKARHTYAMDKYAQ